MDKDWKNEMSVVTEFVGLLFQFFAIIALLVTIIIVIDRYIFCQYYEIPVTYSSLDPISVVPIVVITLPIILYFLLTISFEYKKLEPRLIPYYKLISLIKGAFLFELKLRKKIITREKHKEVETAIPLASVAALAMLIILLIEVWYKKSSFIVSEEKSVPLRDVSLFLLLVLCFMMLTKACKILMLHAHNEYYLYRKSLEQNDNETNIDIKESLIRKQAKQLRSAWIKIIVVFVTIIFMVSSIINIFRTTYLAQKHQYGIVEVKNEDIVQTYIVVLDLDNYYVLEPVEEKDEEIVIVTGKYIYKAKDDVEVFQRYYTKVVIDRFSDRIREKYKGK